MPTPHNKPVGRGYRAYGSNTDQVFPISRVSHKYDSNLLPNVLVSQLLHGSTAMPVAFRTLIIFAFLTLVAGFATKYQDMDFAGGVAAQQMTADTFRIVSRGNGYSDATTIRDYAILKAAETTKQKGGTHFVLIGGNDASSADQVTMPGTAHTTVIGNAAYTTYNPAQSIPIFKPGQDLYIRVLAVKPAQAPPAGAISADEIIQFVGSRVERG
jgi:hypothetical protein